MVSQLANGQWEPDNCSSHLQNRQSLDQDQQQRPDSTPHLDTPPIERDPPTDRATISSSTELPILSNSLTDFNDATNDEICASKRGRGRPPKSKIKKNSKSCDIEKKKRKKKKIALSSGMTTMTSTTAASGAASSPAYSRSLPLLGSDSGLMRAARWALPLISALVEDAATLSVNLTIPPSTGNDSALAEEPDIPYDAEDATSRLRVIRLRIALLEAVMDMLVYTGSWTIVQVD